MNDVAILKVLAVPNSASRHATGILILLSHRVTYSERDPSASIPRNPVPHASEDLLTYSPTC
jgi:hypothetical protein